MKKNLNLLFWPIIIGAFLFTRLVNLKIIPIFTDEAIYSFWAQVALNDPENRYISLIDGKQPFFIWLAAISQKFIQDPLIATRLISVLAGLGALVGIYLLSKELFDNKVARISAILYLILPITLLYDRLALFDSLLTMLGIYAIWFSVKMIKNPQRDIAFVNGMVIGAALITKSSGFFFLLFLPFSLLFLNIKEKKLRQKIIKIILYSLITVTISLLIYNALRLSPYFYLIARKNLTFIRSFGEVFSNPFEYFYSNLNALTGWVAVYLSPLLFLVFLLGAIKGILKRNLKILYLLILIIGPFTAELFFNKVLYARFILFYFPYIIIIVAFTLVNWLTYTQKYQKIAVTLVILILSIPALNSFKLLTAPTQANIPENDSNQYLNDWPAGFGVSEVIDILKQESRDKVVYIGTEGTFGLYPYSLYIYFRGSENIKIFAYWPVHSNELPEEIMEYAKTNKTYFVFNANQDDITNPKLKLISTYQKGTGDSYMRLYEIVP